MSELTTPSYLKQLCKEYGLTPSKKYGQNFLISDAPIKKMIEAAGVKTGDMVIEIGAGFGVLTFALAEKGACIKAFEIERCLQPYWDVKLKKDLKTKRLEDGEGHIEIIWGDALHSLKNKSSNFSIFQSSFKVIANLPYQITSHVLRTLLELEHKPESITVMVQKEVAQRIVAKPGDMSILSVSVQYFGDPKIICKVPKGNFWPMPKVDSAVVTIALKHNSTQALFDKRFFEIVKAGFANKRKQLWKNLAEGLHSNRDFVQGIVQEVAGNERARAQELSVEQWISLTKKLT